MNGKDCFIRRYFRGAGVDVCQVDARANGEDAIGHIQGVLVERLMVHTA